MPIHALGMQSHIASSSVINATKLTAFMNAVAALGLFQKNDPTAFSTSARTTGVTGASRLVIVVNESGKTAAA